MTCFKVESVGETIDGILVVGDTCQTIIIQSSGLQGPPGPQGTPGVGITLVETPILNNQASPQPISGLIFDSTQYISAVLIYTVFRKTGSTTLTENGFLQFVFTNAGWDFSIGPVASSAGVGFSINSSTGQVSYVSSDIGSGIVTQKFSYSIVQRVGLANA